jgi:hypothetical protein
MGGEAWSSQNQSEYYDHAQVHYNGSPLCFEELLELEERQVGELSSTLGQRFMFFGLCSIGLGLYFGGPGNAIQGLSAFITGAIAFFSDKERARKKIRNRLGEFRDFYDV